MMEIAAERPMPGSPDHVFAYLADLRNHWELTGRAITVVALDGHDRGCVRLHGPLGIRRTALTRLMTVEAPWLIAGAAVVGRRTVARVTWTLAPAGSGTRVRLAATIGVAGPCDRALLALGGRRWLSRRFATVLARLERRLEPSDSTSALGLGSVVGHVAALGGQRQSLGDPLGDPPVHRVRLPTGAAEGAGGHRGAGPE